jgi:hypothetical protein
LTEAREIEIDKLKAKIKEVKIEARADKVEVLGA